MLSHPFTYVTNKQLLHGKENFQYRYSLMIRSFQIILFIAYIIRRTM